MDLEKIVDKGKQHLIDSTALFVVSTPVAGFLENVLSGMSDEQSLKSRIIVGGLYLSGLGGALGYFRDKYRKLMKITEKTKEKYQQMHDMLYVGVATLIVNPMIYVSAGVEDFKQVATASGFAALLAGTVGGVMGYSIDLYRDLANYKKSERIPRRISKLGKHAKKILGAGIFATSMAITGLIYHLTPDERFENEEHTLEFNYVEKEQTTETYNLYNNN